MILLAGKQVNLSLLEEMVDTLPNPGHCKCPKKSTYLYSNSINSNLYGISNPLELTGLTVFDLMKRMGEQKLTKQYVHNVDFLDKKTAGLKKTCIDRSNYIMTYDGILRFQDMYKIPIMKTSGKVIAIFTYSIKRTQEIDLLVLFSMYVKRYQNKKLATLKMLEHTSLSAYFLQQPTYSELYTLFSASYHGEDRRYLGSILGISFKTVQKHMESLKEKLHYDVSFRELLHYLRMPKKEMEQ